MWNKAIYYNPAYLTYMQSILCEMSSWMTHKLESTLLGEISRTSDMHMIPLLAESEEKLKRLLMKVKEESEKAGLKCNFQNMEIMKSGPVTSWKRFWEK